MSLYLGNTVISGVTTPLNGSIAIGQIISSIIPLTDAGLHLLDGSVIQGGGVYNDFVQYIASLVNLYPSCFTDETTWQNTVSSKGACGKFVYDSTNNTVRLPKITGFIEGTVDSSALGDLVEAGLPNISGGVQVISLVSSSSNTVVDNIIKDGAFNASFGSSLKSLSQQNTTEATWFREGKIRVDASYSSSIYGNSSTVQPQSIKVFYYIVIATTTKTDIEVDIDEVITDLNAIDSNAVHKTGNETISGEKSFTNTLREKTTSTSFGAYVDFIQEINNSRRGTIRTAYNSDGSYSITLGSNGPDANAPEGIKVTRNSSSIWTSAPASDANNSIVTTINKSKATNGYFQLGNGLIINWGRTSNTQQTNVTFSKAYSSADSYAVIAVPYTSSNSNQDGYSCYVTNLSATGCTIWNKMYGSSISAIKHWIAIGY